MADYLVRWEIDMEDVATPEEAAARALIVQRDAQSMATVFQVTNKKTGETFKIDMEDVEWLT
jgi:hypothetical protein